MRSIPDNQLDRLFKNVSTFYKGKQHTDYVWFKVVSGLTKDQKLEIVNIIQQYYNGWYKNYGQINGAEFYVQFYNKEHRDLAFDDLIQQHRKYMESEAYTGPASSSTPVSDDKSGFMDVEPEDYDMESEEPQENQENQGSNKTVIIIAAVAVVAVLAVLLFVKD